MKFLIAADGSPYTQRVLAYLANHVAFLDASHAYTVVHSVMEVPPRAAGFLSSALITEAYQDDAEKVFKPIRTFFDAQGIEANFIYTVGHAAKSIAEMAQNGAYDIIIMGTHGNGAFANLVLGSVATKVIASCTVPVLLVR